MYIYWLFRSGSLLSFSLWLMLMMLWWIGGWGLLNIGFNWNELRNKAIVAWGTGLLTYLWLVNLVGRMLPPVWAFTLPAFLLAGGGMVLGGQPGQILRDFVQGVLDGWRMWLAFGVVAFIALEVEFGLLVFDEHKNLSLISTLAAGFIPAVNFYHPPQKLAYHYGFQLLGASLVRVGDMFPWVAFDVSKALVLAYVVLLGWLVGKAYLQRAWEQYLFIGAILFAGGTRYLLLLIPQPLLKYIDPVVTLWGTTAEFGRRLSQVLPVTWNVDGGPPTPWPTAFLSGMHNPAVMAHAGPGTFSFALLLLIWLLALRQRSWQSVMVFVPLLSMWALIWETSYGLIIVGTVLFLLGAWITRQKQWLSYAQGWVVAVVLSLGASLLQGGTLTEFFLKGVRWVSHARGVSVSMLPHGGKDVLGFSWRWPPAIVSSHLGPLPLFSPLGWLVALAEMGIGIVLLPWVLQWVWRRVRSAPETGWILGIYSIGALFGMVVPVFVRYRSDRDITRLTGFGLQLFTLFLVFALVRWGKEGRRDLFRAGLGSLALMMVSGIVLGGVQLSAIQRPDFGEKISRYDVEVSRQVWDKLPKDAIVFDPLGWPAVAVTGRVTRYGEWIYTPTPAFTDLVASPSLRKLRSEGYTHVYIPWEWWYILTSEQRKAFQDKCVKVVAESRLGPERDAHFRRLLDIRSCTP